MITKPISPARKWTFRLLSILLGPLLFLGIIELILSIAGTGYSTDFLISDPNDKTKWQDNKNFSRRFFPPEMTRNSQPILISKDKPKNTHRIVIFGGSAAMGDPDPAFGPLRILEVMLESRYPETNFEVVNTAVTAINSHVVREIAADLEKFESDLWIVYMGNNEVYGPFGAGTVFGSVAPPLWINRTGLFFKKTKIGQLAESIFSGKGKDRKSWGGLEMFLDKLISRDDPVLERVYRNYAYNLSDIISSAREANADVLVSSVAVNLKDCPPFRSNDDTAKRLFGEKKFIEARDEDALRFRADSRINAVAREVAGNQKARFVDAEKGLSADGVPGDELFVDHVHFTFKGSYWLARLFADEAVASLGLGESKNPWLSELDCAERLGLTPVHRIQILREMRQWFSQSPFKDQANNKERDSNIKADLVRFANEQTVQVLDKAESNYDQFLKDDPSDWQLRKEYAILLAARNKNKASSLQYEKIADLLPHRPEMWYRFGSSCQRQSDWAKAQKAFEKAILIKPDFHQAYFSLGLCQIEQKAWSVAGESFEKAVEFKPDYVTAWIRWGQLLESQGKTQEAINKYELALEEVPDSLAVNKLLASRYLQKSDNKKAANYFREAVRVSPKDTESNLGLALSLIKQQKTNEGVPILRNVLKMDPNNSTAKRYLRQLGLDN